MMATTGGNEEPSANGAMTDEALERMGRQYGRTLMAQMLAENITPEQMIVDTNRALERFRGFLRNHAQIEEDIQRADQILRTAIIAECNEIALMIPPTGGALQ